MAAPRPYHRLFGEEPLDFVPGRSRWRYVVLDQHLNPNGALHGGVVSFLLDGAMGRAVRAALEEAAPAPDKVFNVAITLHVTFERPIRKPGTVLYAEGRMTKRGKRIAFAEGELREEGGEVVARATSTHSLLSR
jgi:uncharacterized protein (TIGR00369 family)